jgi:hypothetical protein
MLRKLVQVILVMFSIGCSTQNRIQEWNGCHYEMVRAFSWSDEILDQEIVSNNSINSNIRNIRSFELSSKQIEDLKKILSQPDPDRIMAIMECFSPKAGFVFYGERQKIVGWISIDFDCNKFHSNFVEEKADLSHLLTYCKGLGMIQ